MKNITSQHQFLLESLLFACCLIILTMVSFASHPVLAQSGGIPDQVCVDIDRDGVTTCDGDCDDRNTDVAPNRPELCDGVDNDCDGQIDEELWQPLPNQQGACAANGQICQNGSWVNAPNNQEPGPENCDNIDNDCDGEVDRIVRNSANQQGKCQNNRDICLNGVWEPFMVGYYTPENQDLCNGQDDDCDGEIDEDDSIFTYNAESGRCEAQCPEGQIFNMQAKACEPICQQGQIFNRETKRCDVQCPADQFLSEETGRCEKRCAQGEIINPETGQCQAPCPPGHFFDGLSGQCQSACEVFEGFNADQNRCEAKCDIDQRWDAEELLCVNLCEDGQLFNPLKSECQDLPACASDELTAHKVSCISVDANVTCISAHDETHRTVTFNSNVADVVVSNSHLYVLLQNQKIFRLSLTDAFTIDSAQLLIEGESLEGAQELAVNSKEVLFVMYANAIKQLTDQEMYVIYETQVEQITSIAAIDDLYAMVGGQLNKIDPVTKSATNLHDYRVLIDEKLVDQTESSKLFPARFSLQKHMVLASGAHMDFYNLESNQNHHARFEDYGINTMSVTVHNETNRILAYNPYLPDIILISKEGRVLNETKILDVLPEPVAPSSLNSTTACFAPEVINEETGDEESGDGTPEQQDPEQNNNDEVTQDQEEPNSDSPSDDQSGNDDGSLIGDNRPEDPTVTTITCRDGSVVADIGDCSCVETCDDPKVIEEKFSDAQVNPPEEDDTVKKISDTMSDSDSGSGDDVKKISDVTDASDSSERSADSLDSTLSDSGERVCPLSGKAPVRSLCLVNKKSNRIECYKDKELVRKFETQDVSNLLTTNSGKLVAMTRDRILVHDIMDDNEKEPDSILEKLDSSETIRPKQIQLADDQEQIIVLHQDKSGSSKQITIDMTRKTITNESPQITEKVDAALLDQRDERIYTISKDAGSISVYDTHTGEQLEKILLSEEEKISLQEKDGSIKTLSIEDDELQVYWEDNSRTKIILQDDEQAHIDEDESTKLFIPELGSGEYVEIERKFTDLADEESEDSIQKIDFKDDDLADQETLSTQVNARVSLATKQASSSSDLPDDLSDDAIGASVYCPVCGTGQSSYLAAGSPEEGDSSIPSSELGGSSSGGSASGMNMQIGGGACSLNTASALSTKTSLVPFLVSFFIAFVTLVRRQKTSV
ncbi:MAG: hypothetical protein H7A33_04505 [Deltaproteobacteria bacterium]|nr:hypothetical protein [Deltaproteobacteria bacterium]